MARHSRRAPLILLLALTVIPHIAAQVTGDLPDLSTVTQTSASSTSTDASSTKSTTDTTTTDASSTSSASFATTGSTNSGNGIRVSNLPTIAGAGIPTMVVPDTSAAPFMQQSKLPEGTVFIVVGAVLAFMGACVLFWRGLVAWSINRSVRKSALASIRGSEKDQRSWGGSTGYNPLSGGGGKKSHKSMPANRFHDVDSSSVSLDALTPGGKPLHSRNAEPPATGQAGLFFSPTAQARHTSWGGDPSRPLADSSQARASTYLPAGYYASPSSHAPQNTTLGGHGASSSPNRISRQPNPNPTSRRSYMDPAVRNSYLDPSGAHGLRNKGSDSDIGESSRAPSAYFEDLLDQHGTGPRERF